VDKFDLLQHILVMAAYLFAWEFIFRGFLLFGLKERLGPWSMVIQMIPFVLLRFGKPEL
jgi:membrane protease YdiL (CAAX protease family)